MKKADDIVAKAKVKAMAFLARNHNVTVGQLITYLFMVRREHVPVIIETWKAHGLSPELMQAVVDRFAFTKPTEAS